MKHVTVLDIILIFFILYYFIIFYNVVFAIEVKIFKNIYLFIFPLIFFFFNFNQI